MNIFQQDTRDMGLSSKSIEKSDSDIQTIKDLNKLTTETGNTLVIFGGYATEAHCGGKITRPHGDIDVHILTNESSSDDLFARIDSVLKQEKTDWKIRNKKLDKVEYIEDVKNKDFFDLRRVEIHVDSLDKSTIKFSKKKLIDSQEKEVEVYVRDLNQLIKHKLQKFYELRNGVDISKDRHSGKSDLFDVRRLLELQELDVEKIKKELPLEYKYLQGLIEKYK